MTTTTIASNGATEELEIVSEPNGTYTIKPKVKPPANLSLKAAVIYAVHQTHRGERKDASVQFKAPVAARLDGNAHARIDAAVAKRERKAAKRRGGV
jgi:hypothetical protein